MSDAQRAVVEYAPQLWAAGTAAWIVMKLVKIMTIRTFR